MTLIRVLLQARTASTRLPAKSLLPVSGVPLGLLCARRLMATGLEVVLCTSDAPSDDLLATIARQDGITTCRGSLDDVLGRFHGCIGDLADGDVVVRMTADNPVPDGRLVRRLVADFAKLDVDYYATSSPRDGLPYGLSAEVMTVAALRAAHTQARLPRDREHVTPWIQRNRRTAWVDGRHLLGLKDLSHLSCTVDTLDDYLRINRVFALVGEEPVAAGWEQLVAALSELPDMPSFRVPYRLRDGAVSSRMALGTVQLGLNYGIANMTGQPSEATSLKIVRGALAHGVTWIDTARAYGTAEQCIGAALAIGGRERVRVVTKLDPLAYLPGNADPAWVDAVVDASLCGSAHALKCERLDVLLLHRWQHRTSHSGRVWERLLLGRQAGLIGELGASVENPIEAIEALLDDDVRHLQLPFNLLDQRWLQPNFQQALARRADVRIHVRSVFLQGLLLQDGSAWPAWDAEAARRINKIDDLVRQFARTGRADLCIAYILAHPWVDSVVLGMETPEQLQANLELSCREPLDEKQCGLVREALTGAPARLINPAQ